MVAPSLFSSKTDEWATPWDLFSKLDLLFDFERDVCASPNNTKCYYFFTKEDDGLKQDWGHKRVWCNPPYGKEITKWVEKCYNHNGLAVMLLPVRTDTRWWQSYINNNPNVHIIFIKGRLKFGGAKNPAPFPSAIVMFLNFDTIKLD